jgi:hypothetical protein
MCHLVVLEDNKNKACLVPRRYFQFNNICFFLFLSEKALYTGNPPREEVFPFLKGKVTMGGLRREANLQ